MKKILIACSAVLLASTAFADLTQGNYSVGAGAEYIMFAHSRHLNNGTGGVLTGQYFTAAKWSTNLNLGAFTTTQNRAPKKSVNGELYTLTENYYFQTMQGLSPYLTAGAGAWHFSRVSNSDPQTQANLLGGVGALYFVDTSIAFDLSVNEVFDATTGQSDPMANLNLRFFFGGASAAGNAQSS